jgi:hypothetical protein
LANITVSDYPFDILKGLFILIVSSMKSSSSLMPTDSKNWDEHGYF